MTTVLVAWLLKHFLIWLWYIGMRWRFSALAERSSALISVVGSFFWMDLYGTALFVFSFRARQDNFHASKLQGQSMFKVNRLIFNTNLLYMNANTNKTLGQHLWNNWYTGNIHLKLIICNFLHACDVVSDFSLWIILSCHWNSRLIMLWLWFPPSCCWV